MARRLTSVAVASCWGVLVIFGAASAATRPDLDRAPAAVAGASVPAAAAVGTEASAVGRPGAGDGAAAKSEPRIEARIAALLRKMTLEQKVAQMIQADMRSVTPEDVRKYRLGSILNGGGAFPNNEKHSTAADWVAL